MRNHHSNQSKIRNPKPQIEEIPNPQSHIPNRDNLKSQIRNPQSPIIHTFHSTRIMVPLPAPDLMSKSAPDSPARSRILANPNPRREGCMEMVLATSKPTPLSWMLNMILLSCCSKDSWTPSALLCLATLFRASCRIR